MATWHTHWRLLVITFQHAKRSWIEEERKNLITMEEIKAIDEQFARTEELLNTYNHTPRDQSNFFSSYTRLKRLVCEAEIKMGYISILSLE